MRTVSPGDARIRALRESRVQFRRWRETWPYGDRHCVCGPDAEKFGHVRLCSLGNLLDLVRAI
jgi:hypothetical protein